MLDDWQVRRSYNHIKTFAEPVAIGTNIGATYTTEQIHIDSCVWPGRGITYTHMHTAHHTNARSNVHQTSGQLIRSEWSDHTIV